MFMNSKEYKTYKKLSDAKPTLKNVSLFLVYEKKLLLMAKGWGLNEKTTQYIWKKPMKKLKQKEFDEQEFGTLWQRIWPEGQDDYNIKRALEEIKAYDYGS